MLKLYFMLLDFGGLSDKSQNNEDSVNKEFSCLNYFSYFVYGTSSYSPKIKVFKLRHEWYTHVQQKMYYSSIPRKLKNL